MLKFLCFILLAHANLVSPAKPAHNLSSRNKRIFILAGQSNMSGRGGVVNGTWNGVVPLQCHPSSAIRRLNAGLKWTRATEPLHRDIDINTTCGIGPGMAFAHSLLDRDSSSGVVGLVPCAVGSYIGTKISEWARGTFLYNQLVRRAEAAVKGGGRIEAMLWYQGESDTVNLEDAEMYKDRLEKLFMDLRRDLNSSELPIIQVALASGGPYIEKVREAQLGTNISNVTCVDAKGLPLNPDHVHLSTSAEIRLGKMLADAFLSAKIKG